MQLMVGFINSFSARNVVIPCETSVFANAKDGHRFSYDYETMQWQLYKCDNQNMLKSTPLKYIILQTDIFLITNFILKYIAQKI